MNRKSILPTFLVASSLACVLAVSVVVPAEPTGTCLSARVPGRIVLPDGSVHPPGDLALCLERHLNPVTEMDRIEVEGMARGLFSGRRSRPEEPITRPALVFHRSDNDDWILVGLIRPSRSTGGNATGVRFVDPERLRSLRARGLAERPVEDDSRLALTLSNESGESEPVVYLAAYTASR